MLEKGKPFPSPTKEISFEHIGSYPVIFILEISVKKEENSHPCIVHSGLLLLVSYLMRPRILSVLSQFVPY